MSMNIDELMRLPGLSKVTDKNGVCWEKTNWADDEWEHNISFESPAELIAEFGYPDGDHYSWGFVDSYYLFNAFEPIRPVT